MYKRLCGPISISDSFLSHQLRLGYPYALESRQAGQQGGISTTGHNLQHNVFRTVHRRYEALRALRPVRTIRLPLNPNRVWACDKSGSDPILAYISRDANLHVLWGFDGVSVDEDGRVAAAYSSQIDLSAPDTIPNYSLATNRNYFSSSKIREAWGFTIPTKTNTSTSIHDTTLLACSTGLVAMPEFTMEHVHTFLFFDVAVKGLARFVFGLKVAHITYHQNSIRACTHNRYYFAYFVAANVFEGIEVHRLDLGMLDSLVHRIPLDQFVDAGRFRYGAHCE